MKKNPVVSIDRASAENCLHVIGALISPNPALHFLVISSQWNCNGARLASLFALTSGEKNEKSLGFVLIRIFARSSRGVCGASGKGHERQ
jgi:hypothetical protein